MENLTPREKKLFAVLLTLRAESVICKTHHGSELHKAQRNADRVIERIFKEMGY